MGIKTKPGFRLIILVAFTGFALTTSLAHAERPSASSLNEGVCDVLSDATPSLASLCVNYCEARDCVNSDDPQCDNLLANYDRHRGVGDPEMPCLQTCSCYTPDDLRNHPAELVTCLQGHDENSDFLAITDERDTSGAATGINYGTDFIHCVYTDYSQGAGVFAPIFISEEEAAVCRGIIAAEIEERGFICKVIF